MLKPSKQLCVYGYQVTNAFGKIYALPLYTNYYQTSKMIDSHLQTAIKKIYVRILNQWVQTYTNTRTNSPYEGSNRLIRKQASTCIEINEFKPTQKTRTNCPYEWSNRLIRK